MPEKITARYRITTPMFIGDAAQQASGISPAAVKGALRFWWRALNWDVSAKPRIRILPPFNSYTRKKVNCLAVLPTKGKVRQKHSSGLSLKT